MRKINIITNRLQIRPFTKRDICDAYLSGLNDFEIIGLTEARHQNWDREKTEAFIDLNEKSLSSLLLGVFIKTDLKPIGNIRLFNINEIHKNAELSLLFYDKSEWNKGYATEAVNGVVNFAFDKLMLHRIYADYYAINKASSKMFQKAGFKIEGVFKDHFYLNDAFIDSIRIAIINNQNLIIHLT